MTNGHPAQLLIQATDESVELYHMGDAQWVEWVMLGWFAVGAAIAIWYLTVIVKRQRKWLIFTLLGVASVGLIAGGFFVQMGWHGPYIDDEGMWACPSGLNAMRITEANGLKLPDGIVECRADAKRNVATGGVMAGAGILLALASPIVGRGSGVAAHA
ncbi:hypothetical protein [Brevibacterium sp. RIT 803]|uniref:hypothetical protein n=1 Tax=Brevibacterium sp. RIT 803 TaxID=2810210 RepID=UPI00194E214A|nr:hypothetical protein [Brevibacterium sp. RIT 803]MBM6588792.1 hypothetical protein [Brevibacterium sp. RIT 803]